MSSAPKEGPHAVLHPTITIFLHDGWSHFERVAFPNDECMNRNKSRSRESPLVPWAASPTEAEEYRGN